MIYDISPEGLAEDIAEHVADTGSGVAWSVDDCARLIKEWNLLHPEVKDFRDEKIAQARRYGYVSDMFGRIRFIPEVSCPIASIREAGERMAGNMPIQAGSAGMTKLAMAALWRSRPSIGSVDQIRFLLQIHDSLMVEVTDDDEFVKKCSDWMVSTMVNVVSLSIPIKVDIKTGYRWGDLE